MGLGQYNRLGEYCGPHTASSVFLILVFIPGNLDKIFLLRASVLWSIVCRLEVFGRRPAHDLLEGFQSQCLGYCFLVQMLIQLYIPLSAWAMEPNSCCQSPMKLNYKYSDEFVRFAPCPKMSMTYTSCERKSNLGRGKEK